MGIVYTITYSYMYHACKNFSLFTYIDAHMRTDLPHYGAQESLTISQSPRTQSQSQSQSLPSRVPRISHEYYYHTSPQHSTDILQSHVAHVVGCSLTNHQKSLCASSPSSGRTGPITSVLSSARSNKSQQD